MSFAKRVAEKFYDECGDCLWYEYLDDGKPICPERTKKCGNFIQRPPDKPQNTADLPPKAHENNEISGGEG